MNEKLVPIDEKTDIVTIQGFVAKPEFSNGATCEDVYKVYQKIIKSSYLIDKLYFYTTNNIWLYLTVPANTIDINIHPTKTEIKFDNEKALYAMLRATVKHSLGQYNVAPVLDFNRDAGLDTPYHFKGGSASGSVPKISVDPDFNPFKELEQKEIRFPYNREKQTESWESLYTSTAVTDEERQSELFDNQQEIKTQKTFQIQRKYLLSSIKSGVVLINQSLAHQRVLYEEFLASCVLRMSCSLLFPVKISVVSLLD